MSDEDRRLLKREARYIAKLKAELAFEKQALSLALQGATLANYASRHETRIDELKVELRKLGAEATLGLD